MPYVDLDYTRDNGPGKPPGENTGTALQKVEANFLELRDLLGVKGDNLTVGLVQSALSITAPGAPVDNPAFFDHDTDATIITAGGTAGTQTGVYQKAHSNLPAGDYGVIASYWVETSNPGRTQLEVSFDGGSIFTPIGSQEATHDNGSVNYDTYDRHRVLHAAFNNPADQDVIIRVAHTSEGNTVQYQPTGVVDNRWARQVTLFSLSARQAALKTFYARCFTPPAQTVSSSETQLDFGTADYDPDGITDNTSGTKITAPFSGTLLINAVVAWNDATSRESFIALYKNAGKLKDAQRPDVTQSSNQSHEVSFSIEVTAGDEIHLTHRLSAGSHALVTSLSRLEAILISESATLANIQSVGDLVDDLDSAGAALPSFIEVQLGAFETKFIDDADVPRVGTFIWEAQGDEGGGMFSAYRAGTYNRLAGIGLTEGGTSTAVTYRGLNFSAGGTNGLNFFLESNSAGARVGINQNNNFSRTVRVMHLFTRLGKVI